jgi:predicted MFS family arabinose efflux permease
MEEAASAASAKGVPQTPLTPGLIRLMAAACGMSVANMYYCQPLLAQMRGTFRVTMPQISAVPIVTQLGCAAGMLLFVPMGDIRERRRLILQLLMAVTLALGVACAAPGLGWILAGSLAIGLTSVVPHLILPFAAQLARPEERGRAVGSVLSGLLIGILLARTVAGHVGDQYGWRTMYGLAALVMIGLALVLQRALPRSVPSADLTYGQMLHSLIGLIRTQPLLREASLIGALTMGTFMAFWNALVFLLEGKPYLYAHPGEAAGLFGLVGVVGAGAAPLMGRIADKRGPRLTLGVALIVTLVSYGLFWVAGFHLWGLIVGVVLMDFGVQSAHVSNQTRIYSLIPEARSRLNTVYMVSYFLGGVLGTSLGAQGWRQAGWYGVCMVGAGLMAAALLVYGLGARRQQ